MNIETELRLARERIAQLRSQNEYLEERLRDERERFAPVRVFPVAWGLTRLETTLLAALASREMVSRDHLMAAMYPPHVRDEINPKIVEVTICKIRAKLRPLGMEIHTRWGMGWHVDADVRARLNAELKVAA
jgi:two-component system cell cycle response regulator CtrA